MTLSQSERPLVFTPTSLDEELLLTRMTAREELGRLPRYDLELVSENTEIAFERIVGDTAVVTIEREGQEPRCVHGIVNHFEHLPTHGDLARYRATLVPTTWYLTQASNCRIFQDKSVLEIVLEVLRGHGITDIDDRTSERYEAREYCVQWRESDYDFISRLMEDVGIYFFFDYGPTTHTIVLCDSLAAHDSAGSFVYHPGSDGRRPANSICSWRVSRTIRAATVSQNAYDYHVPKKSLVAFSQAMRNDVAPKLEIYDPEQEYRERTDGETAAKIQRESIDARYETVEGSSDTRLLELGVLFSLERAPREDQNRDYLVTSTTYEVTNNDVTSGDGGSAEFVMSFKAIDARVPFRLERKTKHPVVQGPQTAIVVGKDDEEIWTDSLGRVKVQFHWDRDGEFDENSSCWVRVRQAWAGRDFGSMFIPRVGMEVIVDFLNGDPDRPLVSGCVHNGDNGTPLTLPAKRAVSGWFTNTTEGGNQKHIIATGDQKGRERIVIDSKKDLFIKADNDRTETVKGHRDLTVGKDKREEIEWNRHETVRKSHMESIGGDRNLTVGGKEAKKVGGSQSLKVDGACMEQYASFDAKSGEYKVSASNITFDASSTITLQAGGSRIVIDAGNVKVFAPKIYLEAGQVDVDTATVNCTAGTISAPSAAATFNSVTATTGTLTSLTSSSVNATAMVTQAIAASAYSPGAGNLM